MKNLYEQLGFIEGKLWTKIRKEIPGQFSLQEVPNIWEKFALDSRLKILHQLRKQLYKKIPKILV